jgi:hypothetical protein
MSTPSGESLQVKISHIKYLVLLTNRTVKKKCYLFSDYLSPNRRICLSDNIFVDAMTCDISGFCHDMGEALLLLIIGGQLDL